MVFWRLYNISSIQTRCRNFNSFIYTTMQKIKIMRDWTTAVLTVSKSYYIRQMLNWKSYNRPRNWNEKYDRVEYYDLRWNYIPLAMAECTTCWEIVQSQYCGHYTTCSCWNTAVDSDRWMPERHRIITKSKEKIK